MKILLNVQYVKGNTANLAFHYRQDNTVSADMLYGVSLK